jgi:hypothetical protein
MRAVVLAAALAAVLVRPANAAPHEIWDQALRACTAEIGEQSGHWPQWAECTALSVWGARPQALFDACIQAEEQKRAAERMCQLCGNPLLDVRHCIESGGP